MFCSKCGASVNENQSFCANCGAQLTPQGNSSQNSFYQSAPTQQQVPTQSQIPGQAFAIASMVLGIVSLVFFCMVWLAIACAILGIVLGCISIWKTNKLQIKNGMATAGIVCSFVSLGLLIIMVILVGEAFVSFFNRLANFNNTINNNMFY